MTQVHNLLQVVLILSASIQKLFKGFLNVQYMGSPVSCSK